MTKEEFIKLYAEKSGVSFRFIHERGLRAEMCNCGEESCRGWQMVSPGVAWQDVDGIWHDQPVVRVN